MKKHYIVFALSTIKPETINYPSEFKVDLDDPRYKNKENIVDCRSNLEPVVKFLMREYYKEDNEFQFIILCTDAVKSDIKNKKDENFVIKKKNGVEVKSEFKKFIDYMDSKHHGENISALNFFKYRIEQLCEEFKGIKLDEYKEINLDENHPMNAIKETIDYIQQNYKKGEKEEDGDEFWVDAHGGFRDISLTLSAIISVLKNTGIKPEDILGVRYGDNKSIVSQKDSFEMFDFVSGMNDFINFGNADVLANYYGCNEEDNENNENSDHQDKKDNKDNKENKEVDLIGDMVESMKKISDGTQYSNYDMYIKGLNKLNGVLVAYNKDRKNISESVEALDIFADMIKNDYGELLDPEERTVIGMIERANNKGMYQQALTFIESAMPKYLVDNGVVYVKGLREEDGDNTEEKQEFEECKNKKDYETCDNATINQFIKSFNFEWFLTNDRPKYAGKPKFNDVAEKEKWKNAKKEHENKIKSDLKDKLLLIEYNEENKPMNLTDVAVPHQLKRFYDATNGEINVDYIPGKNKGKMPFKTELNKEDETTTMYATCFFILHKMLKEYRNVFNHGKSKRPSNIHIKKLIKLYCCLGRELIARTDTKNLKG